MIILNLKQKKNKQILITRKTKKKILIIKEEIIEDLSILKRKKLNSRIQSIILKISLKMTKIYQI